MLRTFRGLAVFSAIAIAASASAFAQEAGDQEPAPPAVDMYSNSDAAVVLNAHIIALKTAFDLTSEQQKLWQPLEDSIRKIDRDSALRGAKRGSSTPPMDFLDVLDRMADAEMTRSSDLKAFVAAAKPLVASLTEEQKRRAPAFLGMTDNPDSPQPTSELWIFENEQGLN